MGSFGRPSSGDCVCSKAVKYVDDDFDGSKLPSVDTDVVDFMLTGLQFS